MAGFFQEKNGDQSSRRLYALFYVVNSLLLFALAALRESKWAFWGGVACTVASIVYPILTTAQDLKEIAHIVRDQAIPSGSSYDRSEEK